MAKETQWIDAQIIESGDRLWLSIAIQPNGTIKSMEQADVLLNLYRECIEGHFQKLNEKGKEDQLSK